MATSLLLLWNTQYLEVVYREFVVDYVRGQSFATRVKPKNEKMRMVLDGQQRLQSLYLAVFGTYDGRRLYFNVTSGPTGTEPSEDEGVGKGYRFEFWRDDEPSRPKRLARVADLLRWPEKLEKSEAKKLIGEAGLAEAEAEIAEENIRRLRALFREDIVPVETIDDDVYEADQAMPLEHILEVFVRVNQGGTKLSRSDLMFSLIKTKWVSARPRFNALMADLNRFGGLDIDTDFLIIALQTVADVPIEADVANIERHWATMEPKFSLLEQALKSSIDFCRSAEVRLSSAKLLPTQYVLPIAYFLSRQPRCSVPDTQRGPLRTLLYFLLFNEFLRAKSPNARVRYLREVFRRSPPAVVPLDDLLVEVTHRQRTTSVNTNEQLLSWNPSLALAVAQPAAAKDTLSWQEEPQVDHIFPQAVYRPLHGDAVDDLGNLAFLGRLRNARKNDSEPADYFKNISAEELRDGYLIEDRALLAPDRFEEFVVRRRAAILESVRAFLGR